MPYRWETDITPSSGGSDPFAKGYQSARVTEKKVWYDEAATPGEDTVSAMNALVANYNKAYGEANAANEARYQQMLAIADNTTSQRAADIRSGAQGQVSDMMQQLARTGMANTTIAPTMTAGINRQREEALDRSADQMQQTKLGIIERRTDEAPSSANLQNILAGMASGYEGGGGNLSALTAMAAMGSGATTPAVVSSGKKTNGRQTSFAAEKAIESRRLG